MDNHQINTISYGERIDTDVDTMVDGMFELFDDFCDLALSRIYNLTHGMTNGFDFDALFPEEISRFKVTWIICLSELMFFSMKDQPKLKYLKAHFREIMNLEAQERALQTFINQALVRIPKVIEEDKDFVQIWDITSTCKYAKRHLTQRKKFYKEAQYPFTIEKIDWN